MIECKRHYLLSYHGICIDGVLYYPAEATETMIVCLDVRLEKFSYIKIDDESMTRGSTLVNYKGKSLNWVGVHFTDIGRRNLQFWLVEQDHAGK